MRSKIRSLTSGPIILAFVFAVLLLLSTPSGSSASLLDGDWSFQALMDDLVHLLKADEQEKAPPAEEVDNGTAGADPNGESKPSEGKDG